MSLIGGPELHARLEAIQHSGEAVARKWAEENVRRMRAQIQRRTGKTAASVHVDRVSDTGARVVGRPVVNFLASGTKAHTEEPKGQAMKFQVGGQTIFSKKVFHPATRGNPAIRQASRDALNQEDFTEIVYDRWNGAA